MMIILHELRQVLGIYGKGWRANELLGTIFGNGWANIINTRSSRLDLRWNLVSELNSLRQKPILSGLFRHDLRKQDHLRQSCQDQNYIPWGEPNLMRLGSRLGLDLGFAHGSPTPPTLMMPNKLGILRKAKPKALKTFRKIPQSLVDLCL